MQKTKLFIQEITRQKETIKLEALAHKANQDYRSFQSLKKTLETSLLKFIKGDSTYLEKEPLQKISRIKQMAAYKHYGFWHCMDTLRDKENLEKFLKSKNAK